MKLRAAGGPAALVAAALAASLCAPARAGTKGIEYVVISQPRMAQVVYITVDQFRKGTGNETIPLVTSGLQEPYGVAVDHNRQRLFVADPLSEKVFYYKLLFQNGVVHTDGVQYVAMAGISARWVTVDEQGNVYATEEQDSVVKKVPEAGLADGAAPETVYSGSSLPSVSKPGGIWADGAHVFWGNKEDGTGKGSVVRGLEVPDPEDVAGGVSVLSDNVDKVYGVCASQNNVFYTGDAEFVYGVKKNNADSAVASPVSDILVKPRGCTWDGDGTVYVADRGGNAVYSFPSAMHTIGQAEIAKIYTLEDPFGIAVYRPPTKTMSTTVDSNKQTFLGLVDEVEGLFR